MAQMPKDRLHKGMAAPQLRATLADHLTGREIGELNQAIEDLGAQLLAQFDIAQSPVEAGTVLAEGVAAGDPVLGLMIGIPSGLFRADKRAGVYLRYEDGRVTEVISVDINAK